VAVFLACVHLALLAALSLSRRIITARNAAVATGSDAEKRYPARGCGPLHSRLLGDCDTVRGTQWLK